jgi:hypothetical protein
MYHLVDGVVKLTITTEGTFTPTQLIRVVKIIVVNYCFQKECEGVFKGEYCHQNP